MKVIKILLITLLCITDFAKCFFPSVSTIRTNRKLYASTQLHLAASTSNSGDEGTDEEVLLRMNLGIKVGVDPDASLEAVRAYAKSFPFAAVLPVQPLTYTPSEDGRGVKVTFLRKKTKEKGSMDGGIDIIADFTAAKDDEIDLDPLGGKRIQLVATRNSEGQTVNKMFSEKIVVLEFVKGVAGGKVISDGVH